MTEVAEGSVPRASDDSELLAVADDRLRSGSVRSPSAGRSRSSATCTAISWKIASGSRKPTNKEGLALAQLMPGPLAAQLAIYLGYVHYGLIGATLIGVSFVLPSFLMVVALGWAYKL